MKAGKQRDEGHILEDSELIIRNDGSIYHLQLRPEHLADTIIVVGDPNRVKMISDKFDSVEYRISGREFHTHTGHLNGKRISVLIPGKVPWRFWMVTRQSFPVSRMRVRWWHESLTRKTQCLR